MHTPDFRQWGRHKHYNFHIQLLHLYCVVISTGGESDSVDDRDLPQQMVVPEHGLAVGSEQGAS